jgi:hypothetical protein
VDLARIDFYCICVFVVVLLLTIQLFVRINIGPTFYFDLLCILWIRINMIIIVIAVLALILFGSSLFLPTEFDRIFQRSSFELPAASVVPRRHWRRMVVRRATSGSWLQNEANPSPNQVHRPRIAVEQFDLVLCLVERQTEAFWTTYSVSLNCYPLSLIQCSRPGYYSLLVFENFIIFHQDSVIHVFFLFRLCITLSYRLRWINLIRTSFTVHVWGGVTVSSIFNSP